MPEWTNQQAGALTQVARWLADPNRKQVFRLFGFAGTGKTTLAKHFAEGVDGTVLFAAHTGKAAYVLTQKGCPAQTICSLIYRARDKSRNKLRELEANLILLIDELKAEGLSPDAVLKHKRVVDLTALVKREQDSANGPFFQLRDDSPLLGAKLLILDEVSMVDEQMGEDLLSFGVPILALGDPAQLPPVRGEGFFTQAEPDVMLTDVRRQDLESPILWIATELRNQRRPKLGRYSEEVRIVDVDDIDQSHALAADQILVGRNRTRNSSNARMRQLLGRAGPSPQAEDLLVCLRNNTEYGLLNGAQWVVQETRPSEDGEDFLDLFIREREAETGAQWVKAHHRPFLGTEVPWYEKKDANEFDYGHAMTVHKAQGSQWRNVLLFDESGAFRADWWRHAYTGATRAEFGLIIVRGL